MAYGSWPSSFTSSSYVAMGSRPLQIFSTMMVGAPIIWDTHTTASSGTSSGEMSSTSPYFLMASMAMSLPTYGSPPPPAPRTVAPSAMSSISLMPIFLLMMEWNLSSKML